jgi:thioredoxin 1
MSLFGAFLVTSLNSENFAKEVKDAPSVILFWTAWCGPCFSQEDDLGKLEGLFPAVRFRKVNCEENPDLSSDISAVPTLVFYKNGKPTKRLVGLQDPELLKETINKL